jgi:hypothetical protein
MPWPPLLIAIVKTGCRHSSRAFGPDTGAVNQRECRAARRVARGKVSPIHNQNPHNDFYATASVRRTPTVLASGQFVDPSG